MQWPRHVVIVESGSSCARALRGPAYVVQGFRKADAAYHAIGTGSVDALVVHIEETDEFDDRVALVRMLQTVESTRSLPVLVVITQRPDRPSAMTTQRYGSAVIQLTNADCAGLADAVDALFYERGGAAT